MKPDPEFTTRLLISLTEEMATHLASTERLRIQVEALAKEYGVQMPAAAVDTE